MKIKINAIILFLPVFFVLGCDSGQDTPVGEKAEMSQAAPETIEENTAPMNVPEPMAENAGNDEARAEAESEPVQQAAISGEQVYQKSCASCHKMGIAGAPKFGDVAAWAPRIAKGKEALYNSAKKGVSGTAMMARGSCLACSDEELEAAVDFMVSSSE